MMSLAIACGSGGYRTVFIHGVLSALEDAGFRANAYAGTSASVLTAAAAAVGKCNEIGVQYWQTVLERKFTASQGMSEVMLGNIADWGQYLAGFLFQPEQPRFFIPVSYVKTETGAAQTQSKEARRLGRKLVLSAARRQANPWVEENLEHHMFDSHGGDHPLTPENFDEVAYATTRMMHAWDIPATIDGKPYVDASYLCAIPAVEMVEYGYTEVIAIAADPPGTLYRDIFGTREVPSMVNGATIHIILPDEDPGPQGADFTDATEEGLRNVYRHGQEKGRIFAQTYQQS